MLSRSHRCIYGIVCAFACLIGTLGIGGCGSGGAGTQITAVNISPVRAAVVVITQTMQFKATTTGDPTNSVSWSVDGVSGGNAVVGAISTGGAYTPPAAAGTHTVRATSTVDTTKAASATIAVTDLAGVVTYHNNLARDGTNPQEYALTTSTVKTATFGKLFSCPVDGAAYSQPLWVPGLSIGAQVRDAIFVATQHDTAYSFDADANPCSQLWHVNLLDAAHGGTAGETSVPTGDVGNGYKDIQPEIGVTGTPVIDLASGTLYVVSKSEGPAGSFHQRLHALDLITGDEKFTGPIDITASVPGTGDGSVGGVLTFDSRNQGQRGALTLLNGIVYIIWASHEDRDPYHGWLLGYDAGTLAQVAAFSPNPNGSRGGMWMAGGAPASDGSGSLFLSTGNGTFDGNSGTPPNDDFGDTVVKVGTSSGLSLVDWFTPFNQAFLNGQDADLGSGGVVVLPDQTSGPAHLLVAGGKQGRIYLLDRDAMGNYCASCTTTDTNILQSFLATPAIFGTPAFWQNKLYLGGTSDALSLFAFDATTGIFNTVASSKSATIFQFPGATPSISAHGASDGVLWAIDSSQYGVPSAYGLGAAVLHAYDAANLSAELWNSSQATSNRDTAGNAVKFAVPTVANGRVYIGTRTEIDVYGLLPN
ncbi:MAG TPA: hypothetical protein VKD23_15475 [Terriglobales bacterium]|nr:hypothetical protein [Terriglobales bacterium]